MGFSYTVEPRCVEVEGTAPKYSTHPRFDSSEVECVVINFECMKYGMIFV